MRDEAALLVDGLLVRVARGRGALDVAIAEGLDALATRAGTMRRYSGIGDFAREELGIAAGTAPRLARLGRALRERPLLRAAVRSGEVTARKAETVVSVARGDDEARWVERARTATVRALAAEVRSAATGRASGGRAPARPVPVPVRRRAVGARLGDALARTNARRWTGRSRSPEHRSAPTAPKWQRLEAICEEYLGAHPVEPAARRRRGVLHFAVSSATSRR